MSLTGFTLLTLLFPVIGAIVLIGWNFVFPINQNRSWIAVFASVATVVFATFVAVMVFFGDELYGTTVTNSRISIGDELKLIIFQDRMTSCWLLLNGLLALQILLSGMGASASPRAVASRSALTLLMLASSQVVVFQGDALWQWGALALGNWLLFLYIRSTNPESSHNGGEVQLLVFLTLADFFWMLGMVGLYFATGTLEISILTEPTRYANLGTTTNTVLVPAVISLLVSLAIRLGLFPANIWTNAGTISSGAAANLMVFTLGTAGFLLFRWLPILVMFPEPRTLLIGVVGLSAILLSLSALLHTGLKKLLRLASVPLAFAVIGVVTDPRLWPQMASLIAGSIVITISLCVQSSVVPARVRAWGGRVMVAILLCGPFGIEAIFYAIRTGMNGTAVEVPAVMLPLMVFSLGLFVFGIQQVFEPPGPDREEASKPVEDERHDELIPRQPTFIEWLNIPLGIGLLLLACGIPFLFRSIGSYDFLPPYLSVPVAGIALMVGKKLRMQSVSTAPELGSLLRLCSRDYHIATVIDRGIVVPIETAASLIHLFDQFVLPAILRDFPQWLRKEITEISDLIDREASTIFHVGVLCVTFIVLMVAVFAAS